MSLAITHTHAEGTLLDGTTRGDGAFEVLKTRPGGAYWKWSRNLGAFYIPQSRDKLPNDYRIEQTAKALRAAGFEVEVTVDRATRATAETVEAKRERLGDRADALAAKAEKRGAEAESRIGAAREIGSHIPFGQPILVGHHSEGRHRRDLARIETNYRRGFEAMDEARDAARRAEIARRAASGKEARSTVQNRIDKLRAEIAVDLRALWGVPADMRHLPWTVVPKILERLGHADRGPVDQESGRGERLIERITYATEQRHYWTEVLAAMPAGVDPKAVKKGDMVRGRFGWATVARVNAKTVSVETGYSWTDRWPWAEVRGHRPAGVTADATD